MKAIVIEEMVTEGMMGHIHGQCFPVKRIVIKARKKSDPDIAITLFEGRMSISDFDLKDREYKIVKEINIPNRLVQLALVCVLTQQELEKEKALLEKLLA